MTIRARRAGRARHFQNPRAITRARFTPYPEEQEDPMRTTRDITPERLALYCEDLDDVRVRTTTDGGWLVYGPQERDGGSAVIPRTWEHGRGRENVLAALRRAGVDLTGLDPDSRPDTDDAPSPANVAKLRLPGPRPSLAYEKTTPKEPTVPDSDQPTKTQPAGEQPDLDTLWAMFTEQADELAAVRDRLADVEKDLADVRHNAPGERERKTQARRDAVVAFFQQLPTGFRVTAGMVNENLGVPEDERRAYGDTLRQLVTDGVLTSNGGTGTVGGRHAHYQLVPAQQEAKAG